MRVVDISKQLSLLGNTVAPYIKSIFRKLENSSRTDASWYATMLDVTPGKAEGDKIPAADAAVDHGSNSS